MDSSLWMPLNGRDQLGIGQDVTEWTSGICAQPTAQRMGDCFCAFCCSACAFSAEWVLVNQVTQNNGCCGFGKAYPSDTDLSGCDKYCDCCACCIYLCFVALVPIPCCLNCCLRGQYRNADDVKIQGGPCTDCVATFVCCCCAHVQVDRMPQPLRPPRARRAPAHHVRPLTHATTHRLWTT
jgi:hypothetical protein